MGVSTRTDVQPLGVTLSAVYGSPVGGGEVPVVSVTGMVPAGLAGEVVLEIVDDASEIFVWYSSESAYGNSSGQWMGYLFPPSPVALEDENVNPGPVGLTVLFEEVSAPYEVGDAYAFVVGFATSSPPTLAATAPVAEARTVLVEVVTGAPTYTFRYTLGTDAPRTVAMDRGSPVALLEADDTPSGLTVAWPNVTTLYPGAAYSWTVAPASLTLTAPSAGAQVVRGAATPIAWTTSDDPIPLVDLELSTDNGATWSTLAASVANTGSYTWTPETSLPATEAARVRVSDASGAAVTDTGPAFTLKGLTLTAPTGSETLTGGTTVQIAWTSAGLFPIGVHIELSTDGGATWSRIASALEDSGAYAWWVPITTAAAARVRVVDAENANVSGDSGSFSVVRAEHTAHGRMLAALLPRGPLWNLDGDSVLSRLLAAFGEELRRVEWRGSRLLEEADPRTAYETLAEWERMLGLPDDAVLEIPVTAEKRRLAVVAKFTAQGGQSLAYFVGLAAACGYAVTIDDAYGLTVARAGRARAGDRGRGRAWAFTWRLDVQPPTGAALSHAELEAIIRRAAPAHTVVLFTYLEG